MILYALKFEREKKKKKKTTPLIQKHFTSGMVEVNSFVSVDKIPLIKKIIIITVLNFFLVSIFIKSCLNGFY